MGGQEASEAGFGGKKASEGTEVHALVERLTAQLLTRIYEKERGFMWKGLRPLGPLLGLMRWVWPTSRPTSRP